MIVYKDVDFKEKMLQDLAETSNKLFKNLKNKRGITEKELKCFKIDFKKATNLSKLYLLPKIHKRLSEVPGRPVISNCRTPTEVSEFLDRELKSVMQEGWSYVKDSGDFIRKLKNIDHIPQDTIMVTADVAGLYPSIPHDAGLEALRKLLDNRENNKISIDDLTKMIEFVLKTAVLDLMERSRNKFWGLPLVPNLRLHTVVYSWTKLRLNFLKRKSISLSFGFVTLMMFSLFVLLVKKSSAYFWKI